MYLNSYHIFVKFNGYDFNRPTFTVLKICGCLNRRLKSYHQLKQDIRGAEDPRVGLCHSGSSTTMLWKLLNRRGVVDQRPLLQDRVVWMRPPPASRRRSRFSSLLPFCTFFFFKCTFFFLTNKCYQLLVNQNMSLNYAKFLSLIKKCCQSNQSIESPLSLCFSIKLCLEHLCPLSFQPKLLAALMV